MSEPGPEAPESPQPADARDLWLRRAWIAVGVGWVAVLIVGALLVLHIRGLEEEARAKAADVERPGVKQAASPEPLDITPEPVAEAPEPPSEAPEPATEAPDQPASEPSSEPAEQEEIANEDDIRQHVSLTMIRNLRPLQACYTVELREDPGLGGTFTLDFAIQRDGVPHEVKISGAELPERLERCMVDAVLEIRFSPIAAETPVNYPLVFRPGN